MVDNLLNTSALFIKKWRMDTKAFMIRMLTRMAVSLLSTEANMATPCSVNANGQTVECLRFLNRSQFVTSSPPPVIMFFSSAIIFLLRG